MNSLIGNTYLVFRNNRTNVAEFYSYIKKMRLMLGKNGLS